MPKTTTYRIACAAMLLAAATAATPELLAQGTLTSGQPTYFSKTGQYSCLGSGIPLPTCYVLSGYYNIDVPQGATKLDVRVNVDANKRYVAVYANPGSSITQSSAGGRPDAWSLGTAYDDSPLQASIAPSATGLSLRPGTWTIGLYMGVQIFNTYSTSGTITATVTSDAQSTAPQVSGISPSSAAAGGPAFTLTVNGTGFVSGSAVQWNGTILSTNFVSATQLTASVPASFIGLQGSANVTVTNPGGVASNPASFTITAPEWVMGTKVLPQFTFGGGWYSAIYFANTTGSAVSFPVTFIGDDGRRMSVPSAGGYSATVSIPAYGTKMIEATNAGSSVQGYATFSLPAGVMGYGVFRQSVSGRDDQEAVVPFSDSSRSASTLVWDDANFTTAIAIVNTGAAHIDVSVKVRDNSGAQLGTATVPLDPGCHTAMALRNIAGLSAMNGKRGYAEFTSTSGTFAVLGLRFGGAAFTSIPAF